MKTSKKNAAVKLLKKFDNDLKAIIISDLQSVTLKNAFKQKTVSVLFVA